MLPLLPHTMDQGQIVNTVAFLRAEGEGANDPELDTLLSFRHGSRFFMYNPSGASGAAGDNGIWGAWHPLCENCSAQDGVVTPQNTILAGSLTRDLSRSTDRGRTWTNAVDGIDAVPIYESALPMMAGPSGERGLVAVVSGDGNTRISRADGAPGSWVPAGNILGRAETFGEVPPSAALPTGRLLAGVWNGVSASTDGGQSYQPTSLYQQGGYIGHSFAFVSVEGHPYGGVVFAGVDHAALAGGNDPRAEVHRSDDGGATWTLAHRFTGEETGLPPLLDDDGNPHHPFSRPEITMSPDGVLWAGVSYEFGATPPGVILRSTDLGATWSRADAGYTGYPAYIYYPASTPEQPFGWNVNRLVLARDGRMYAATGRGVWRTTQPVVSAEAWPTPASSGLALSARPNPSHGSVTLALSSERAERARVEVVDASGRVVHEAIEVWATPTGAELRLPSERWAAGVYVARASVGRHAEHVTARFTVVR